MDRAILARGSEDNVTLFLELISIIVYYMYLYHHVMYDIHPCLYIDGTWNWQWNRRCVRQQQLSLMTQVLHIHMQCCNAEGVEGEGG